jgi:hypothetical protein
MLVTGFWHRLVKVYSGIFHNDSVAVIHQLFDTYIPRQLDRARIGGCSHLPVIARELRGL